MTQRRSVAAAADPSLFEETGELFPGASPASALSIAMLTETARDILEGAFVPMWVRGEVADFKAHRSGHWYFSLRDETSQLRCVVWARDTRRIPAPPDPGMQVVAFGRLTVYAARGEMQFTATALQAEGDGLWRKALEATRRRLEADGLLAPERKRALPAFPRTIAVVTSPDGAALRDIIAVVRRRGSALRLVLVTAAVQGETAPEDLCSALDQVARWGEADLVIIGRGGGSREDLWAFNDERVARALAASAAPTISAVGHEIDMTICDLVADVRAPTPSAAAEIATRARDDLRTRLTAVGGRLGASIRRTLDDAAARIGDGSRSVVREGERAVRERRARLHAAAGRLDALSPVATLGRGYAVARDLDGTGLSAVDEFRTGMPYELVVRDGVVTSIVDHTVKAPDRESA